MNEGGLVLATQSFTDTMIDRLQRTEARLLNLRNELQERRDRFLGQEPPSSVGENDNCISPGVTGEILAIADRIDCIMGSIERISNDMRAI